MSRTNWQTIQTLRAETQAGVMDCKHALVQTEGNVEQAIELLLRRGFQIAEKKKERVAADGVAYAAVIDGAAVLLEVNTETDFVAANSGFLASVGRIAQAIARSRPATVEALLPCPVPGSDETVELLLQKMALAYREKLVLRRFAVLEGPMPVAYTHPGGQYGVILTLTAAGELPNALWETVGKELALQLAASAARYVSRETIGAGERSRVVAGIAAELAADAGISGKPPQIREKILAGRIEKFYRTNCLMEQAYIKNPEQTVEQYLRAVTADWAFPVSVAAFHRYQKAEGLQDPGQQSNLEYARQLNGDSADA